MENGKECCCHKTKKRSEKEYKSLIHRLNRFEGQVRGIKGMVEKDVYCTDILIQVAAVTAALNGFSRELLGNHIRTCVVNDIREGKDETVEELVALLSKLKKKEEIDGSKYSYGNVLCGLQQQGGEGGFEGSRSYILFGQSADEFYGCGRDGLFPGNH